jgi:hypothetical protein
MYKGLMLHHATNVRKVRLEVLPFFKECYSSRECEAYLPFRLLQFSQKCFSINCETIRFYISEGRLFIEMTGAAVGTNSGPLKLIGRGDLPAALEATEESFKKAVVLLAETWEDKFHSQQDRKLLEEGL